MNAFLVRSGLIALAATFVPVAATLATAVPVWRMLAPSGAVPGGGDCNDSDPNVYPEHAEIVGNHFDDDCARCAHTDRSGVGR